MQRTDRSSECWLWTGRLNRSGYAEMKVNGRYRMAHRVAYEELVGPIPDGLQLDHLCRIRHCLNPAHLEPVTSAENTRRSPLRNEIKTHCKKGHPYSAGNTYVWRGHRHCRICKSEASRRHKQRSRGGAK
ncbi:HNH endonuclease signature motif containing protein [Streptomyces asiaticus]|uniref:HNH endonuclease signature motif containing protein n=1 Tax=Streptomyces asiaticus TaxID=114695 RepID=UPI0037FA3873